MENGGSALTSGIAAIHTFTSSSMELLIPKVAIWRYGLRDQVPCFILILHNVHMSTCTCVSVQLADINWSVHRYKGALIDWLRPDLAVCRWSFGQPLTKAAAAVGPFVIFARVNFFLFRHLCIMLDFDCIARLPVSKIWSRWLKASHSSGSLMVVNQRWFQFHIKQDLRKSTSSGNV